MSYGQPYPPQGGQGGPYPPQHYPPQGPPPPHYPSSAQRPAPPGGAPHPAPPPLAHPWHSEWVESERTYVFVNVETRERRHDFPGGHPPPPPQLPRPWRCEWVVSEQHYAYVNVETGRRQREFPGPHPPPAGPSYHPGPPPPAGASYSSSSTTYVQAGVPAGQPQQPPPKKGTDWKTLAMGGAGGALLGGIITHEWDEHKEHKKEDEWRADERREEDRYRREERSDQDEINRLKAENAGLERREYAEEHRPAYGGGSYDRYEERGGYGGGEYVQNTEYVERDNVYEQRDTFVENRVDDVDYRQRDEFVERTDDYDYRQRDEFTERDDVVYESQDTYVDRRDDYGGYERRDDSLVDDAARWAGREEQKVEDIPERIETGFDNVVDDVADVGDSFDQGRDERAYEDDTRYEESRW